MSKPHRKPGPVVLLVGLGAVSVCALGVGLFAINAARTPQPMLVVSDTAGARVAAVEADAKLWAAYAPAPARAALAPDEWTSDAPAFQAGMAHAKLVAPALAAPPPPPPAAAQQQTTAPAPSAQPAATPVPSLAQAQAQASAKDDSKICRNPPVPLDLAQPAPRLRLHYEPRLSSKAPDIAPVGPPPEQERRIRLSSLLAEALQQ